MGDTQKSSSGRMSPGLSVQTEAKTSARSSKKCAVSKTPKCMFLDLRNGGETQMDHRRRNHGRWILCRMENLGRSILGSPPETQ